MDRIKVGVIGCGYWGPKLARNFHEIEEAQLEWVADLDMARLNHIKSLYPDVNTTRDVSEVYASDVDAVVIATPVNTHYQIAKDSLQAGKHILVEKPITACVDQAKEIVARGAELNQVVMVGHTFVFNPAVEAIREIIADGQLGEIYYINGVRANLGLFQPDINVAWDLAPHDISILSYVLGKEPVSVSANGGVYIQRDKGIHDVAYIGLHYPDGVFAEIRSSWLDPIKVRQITFIGSEKMLVYDDIEEVNKIVIYDKGVDLPPYSDTEEEFHISYRSNEGIPYPIHWSEPLRGECQHFIDCINNGHEPRSSGKSGYEVVRVLESIQYSLLHEGKKEAIGDHRGFCAYRTRRETGPRCQDLCLCESLWL